VVTATRDGMNLVPYEYVVCRQGPPGWAEPGHKSQSMLVVSGEKEMGLIWCAQHAVSWCCFAALEMQWPV
jgi:hypothetical protein